jgi:hypothetical protein
MKGWATQDRKLYSIYHLNYEALTKALCKPPPSGSFIFPCPKLGAGPGEKQGPLQNPNFDIPEHLSMPCRSLS